MTLDLRSNSPLARCNLIGEFIGLSAVTFCSLISGGQSPQEINRMRLVTSFYKWFQKQYLFCWRKFIIWYTRVDVNTEVHLDEKSHANLTILLPGINNSLQYLFNMTYPSKYYVLCISYMYLICIFDKDFSWYSTCSGMDMRKLISVLSLLKLHYSDRYCPLFS